MRCRTDYQGRPLRVRQDKTQSGPIPALTPTERGPPLFPESVGDDTAKPSDAAPVNNGRGTGLAGKRGNLPPLRLAPGGGYGAFSSGHSGRLMMPMEGNGMSMAGRGMAPMTPSVSSSTAWEDRPLIVRADAGIHVPCVPLDSAVDANGFPLTGPGALLAGPQQPSIIRLQPVHESRPRCPDPNDTDGRRVQPARAVRDDAREPADGRSE